MNDKFPLGQVVATPAALKAIAAAGQTPDEFLKRHHAGDWGDVDAHDRAENDRALTQGFRLLSTYRTATGVTIWIITEADRLATTILLPDEY